MSVKLFSPPRYDSSRRRVSRARPGNLVRCENHRDYYDKRFPPPFVPGTPFALGNVCVSENGLAGISLQTARLKEPLCSQHPVLSD